MSPTNWNEHMLALSFGLTLMLAAAMMVVFNQRGHIAPVFWCATWGMMLFLYQLLGSAYIYILWPMVLTMMNVLLYIVGHYASVRLVQLGGERHSRPTDYEIKSLGVFLLGCTAVGMLAPLNWAATVGINLADLKNFGAVMDAAQSAHIMLAQQRVEQDSVNKVCLMVALAGVIMAGIHLGVREKGKRLPIWLLLAPTVPYLSMMLLTTIRTMAIVPMLMLFTSWISGLALVGKDRLIFERSRLARVMLGIIAAFAIIVFMQAVRANDTGFTRFTQTFARLRLWFAGYEPAFMVWISSVWDHQWQLGASSFRVIAGAVGAENTKLVYGAGAVDIGDGDTSNAMTAIRFFVEDWGIKGSVAFSALFGALTGLIGEYVRRGKLLLSPLLALLLAATIFSPNSWFLNYGTRVLAPFIVIAYLAVFGSARRGKKIVRRRGPRLPQHSASGAA